MMLIVQIAKFKFHQYPNESCFTKLHHILCNLQLLEAKLEPEEHQKAVIESLNKAAGMDRAQRKRKPRRRKGPNPLSVKKSQRSFIGDRVVEGGVVSRSKVGTLSLCTYCVCINSVCVCVCVCVCPPG